MTDDHRVMEEVQQASHGRWRIVTNTNNHQIGFNACTLPGRYESKHCKHRRRLDKRENMRMSPANGQVEALTLLAALEVTRQAVRFYGDCESNVGHLVQLLRSQPAETARCYDMGRPFKGYGMDIF
eukprot:TRINITY_DN3325_c0_g1_i1.p1 TRINITY_DN3325_c0_g1~~TRINITY_DN3325_c0_g1_i1.p1  ORF type:complete len:126 (+),score=29.57 TRINITY_DN3325_c0_g1_i1:218-595(+)